MFLSIIFGFKYLVTFLNVSFFVCSWLISFNPNKDIINGCVPIIVFLFLNFVFFDILSLSCFCGDNDFGLGDFFGFFFFLINLKQYFLNFIIFFLILLSSSSISVFNFILIILSITLTIPL